MNGQAALLLPSGRTSASMTLSVLQGILAATMTHSSFASNTTTSLIQDVYEHQRIDAPFQATSSSVILANAPRSASEKLESAIQDLISHLENWDGYGAQKISQRSIDYASSFASYYKEIAQSFEPYPETDGTVSLENHWGDSAAYLNFANSGEIAYVLHTRTGAVRGRNFDPIAVKKMLDAIYF